MVKQKLWCQPYSDVVISSFRMTLACPQGRTGMGVLCRGTDCSRLECFDATHYLRMNEKTPSWTFPLCGRLAPFSSLVVDKLFTEILAMTPSDCIMVLFHEDGSWSSLAPKEEMVPVKGASSSSELPACRSSTPPTSTSSELCERPRKWSRIEVIDLAELDDDEDSGTVLLRR
ncbi:hypothetical protein V5799_022610 [Amblyomma americanum]|uniref:SP-RING-type domain-containing protein n=1 Tax=Amblyomma americanum TaxID=6943 RepID=A0AAQ4FJX2_AMBAM